jgi:hypothetical protein
MPGLAKRRDHDQPGAQERCDDDRDARVGADVEGVRYPG